MSIRSIHLRKLLCLMYAPPNVRTRILRADIRSDRDKSLGHDDGGGDFHVPFWSDAKRHVLGEADLVTSVASRIAGNKRRERLYKALSKGFLTWWNDRRRWRNEPLTLLPAPAKAKLQLPALASTVKVENVLGLDSGPSFERLIYPYFSEEPPLAEDAARLGLWAIRTALPETYKLEDMRILDVLRSASFGTLDCALRGDEETEFIRRYQVVLAHWGELKKEY